MQNRSETSKDKSRELKIFFFFGFCFSQRHSGHQTLPSEIFSRSQLPIQTLDFSHNSLRRLSERLFTSVADTIREINLSDNLLGDNLNPIFATTEFQNLKNLKKLDLSGNQIRGLEEGILRGCESLQVICVAEHACRFHYCCCNAIETLFSVTKK